MKLNKIFISICILSFYSVSALACSVFMYSDNSKILFGNNEDSPVGEEAILNFEPSSKSKFGYFFITLTNIANPLVADYPQGGMNEKGLAYDITATPLKTPIELTIPEDTPPLQGNLMKKVLAEASTVDGAIDIIKIYRASQNIREAGLSEFRQIQVFLSDNQGSAAVVGIGRDGDFFVTKKEDNFHLVTNFSLAQRENSVVEEHMRYDIAKKMLSDIKILDVKQVKTILSAIHVEGMASTLYSTIYDLQSLDIYIYNFHNYDFQEKINLRDEIAKGKHTIVLKSLFKDHPVFAVQSMGEHVNTVKSMQSLYQKSVAELKECKEQCR